MTSDPAIPTQAEVHGHPAAAGPSVFLSYRRSDTGEIARNLAARLREDLGSSNVFRDQDDLIAGAPWKDALSDALRTSDAAVFLVGPNWVATQPDGTPRIASVDDPVAEEVRQALDPETGAEPVPVLIDIDAPPKEVPRDIARLFDHHAVKTTRQQLLHHATKDYQSVLVGVWESIRRKTPRGVLVVGDGDAMASLDGVVEEMKRARLIDARRLSRFASGAYVVSARRLRRGAQKWPDAIIVVDDAEASEVVRSRIQAINEHPSIKAASLIGAGITAGFALSQVLGIAATDGSATAFSASTHVMPSVPQIGTGPLGTVSSLWTNAATAARLAVAGAAVAVAGTATVVALQSGALPAEATYGYLNIEARSAASTSEPPLEIDIGEPATYVAVDVALANPLRDVRLSVPTGVFSIEANDNVAWATTVDGGAIELAPRGESELTLWFALPPGTSLADANLVVRERGAEPLVISLNESSDNPERVPISMSDDFSAKCALIEFGPGFASYNVGITEKGDPRPGPGVSPLGRAPEDQVFVSFDVTATESCAGQVTFFNMRYQIYTAIVESRVGSRLVPTADNFPSTIDSITVDGQLVAVAPEDSTDALEIDFGTWLAEERVTLSADLSGIEALVSQE